MIIFLIIIIIYCLGIFYLSLIFLLTKKDVDNTIENKNISILIPFKNEKENLKILIQDLLNLNYPKEKLEIIFIDDNSTDEGYKIVKYAECENFKLLQLSDTHGKKQALKKGLELADGEIIIHTDADVRINKNWLISIVNAFENKEIKLCFGSVIFDKEKNIFEQIQSLELLSLTGISASMGIIKNPILMSGANFAYTKELKQDFIDSINNIASGDDMFFLEKVKEKYPDNIIYIKSNANIVRTKAETTFNSFVNQRIRWAGKSKHFKNLSIILSGLVSLVANFSFLLIIVNYLFVDKLGLIFVMSIFIKFIFEFISLSIYANYFDKQKYLYLFPLLFLIYPFYISFISLASLFIRPKWDKKRG